jgi:hypothetical protein
MFTFCRYYRVVERFKTCERSSRQAQAASSLPVVAGLAFCVGGCPTPDWIRDPHGD